MSWKSILVRCNDETRGGKIGAAAEPAEALQAHLADLPVSLPIVATGALAAPDAPRRHMGIPVPVSQ